MVNLVDWPLKVGLYSGTVLPIIVYTVALIGLIASSIVLVRRYQADVFRFAFVFLILAQMASRMTVFSKWSGMLGRVTTACLVLMLYLAWREMQARSTPIAKPHRWATNFMLLTAAFGLASFFWSKGPIDTANVSLEWMAFVVAIVMTSCGRWLDRSVLAQDLRALFVFANVAFVIGLVATYSGVMKSGFFEGDTFQGLFKNPNTTGSIAMLMLIMGYALLRSKTIAIPSSMTKTSSTRILGTLGLIAVAMGPIFVSLVLCHSRTSQLGVVVAALFIVAMSGRKGAIAVGSLVAVGVAGIIAVLANLFPAVSERLDLADVTFTGRTPYWKAGFELLLNRPWGYGVGTGRQLILDLYDQGIVPVKLSSFHNSYLQLAIEAGTLALIVALCAFGYWIVPMLATKNDPLAVGLSALVVAGAVGRLTESPLFTMGGAAYPIIFWSAFVAVLALYSAQKSAGRHKETEDENSVEELADSPTR